MATRGRPLTSVSVAAVGCGDRGGGAEAQRGGSCRSEGCCCSDPTQTGNPEGPCMEGTLQRKQELQLGGKKVRSPSSSGVQPGEARL